MTLILITLVAMKNLTASAVTHVLVVKDAQASRNWRVSVLDASVLGEYDGGSVVSDSRRPQV